MGGLLQRLMWNLPDEVVGGWTYDTAVDVVIVGGGVPGLCYLARLCELGYSTALVADEFAEPFERWNGVLRSGYDDPDPRLRDSIEDDWLAFLEENDVEHGSDDWYALVRGLTADRLRDEWDEFDYPYEPGSPDDLPPEWHEGSVLDGGSTHEVNAIDEVAVSKADLRAAFVSAYANRLIEGDVTGYEFGQSDGEAVIESVEVDLAAGGTLQLEPGCVVTAAGGETPDVLDAMAEGKGFEPAGGDPDELRSVLDSVAFRDVHLLAIRAPRGALPETSAYLLPRGFTVAVHREEAGEGVGRVTWYVTTESFGSDEDEATGQIDPRRVGGGFSELFSVVPAVRERAERDNSGVEFGVFARMDHEVDGERAEFVERADGVSNLVVTLADPERAWLAVNRVEDAVEEVVAPSDASAWIPTDVAVADLPPPGERGTNWLDWEELVVRYPESDPLPKDPSSTSD